MTRSNSCVDAGLTRFLDVLKLAQREQWIQILPLFGTKTPYQRLHNCSKIERGEIIGLLIYVGLFNFHGTDLEFVKNRAEQITALTFGGVKFNRYNYHYKKKNDDSQQVIFLIYLNKATVSNAPTTVDHAPYLHKCKEKYL